MKYFFWIIGYFVLLGFSIIGLFVSFQFIAVKFGFLFFWLSIMIAPVTFIVVPFYIGFVNGDWWPLFWNYGGLLGMYIAGIGDYFAAKEKERAAQNSPLKKYLDEHKQPGIRYE